jgi:hypothetical protein
MHPIAPCSSFLPAGCNRENTTMTRFHGVLGTLLAQGERASPTADAKAEEISAAIAQKQVARAAREAFDAHLGDPSHDNVIAMISSGSDRIVF